MKEYPSIDREIRKKTPVYVWDKLDGSNLRGEWSRKNGWYKFGKRHGLIGEDYSLGKGIGLIKEKYGEALEKIFVDQRWERVIAFFEFWGPNSFAGQHEASDNHTVTLIDINVHKKGIVGPKEFRDLFSDVDHAKLLYHGNVTDEMIEQIQEGTFPGMTFEGVVCKGANISPGRPLMFKIKNRKWIEKLKQFCNSDVKLFEKLL